MSVCAKNQAALITVLQTHINNPSDGDILVFLPGQEDIEALQSLLQEKRALLRDAIFSFAQKRRRSEEEREDEKGRGSTGLKKKKKKRSRDGGEEQEDDREKNEEEEQQRGHARPERRADWPEASLGNATTRLLGLKFGDEVFYQKVQSFLDFCITPLYAALPFDLQKSVFDKPPEGTRKVRLPRTLSSLSSFSFLSL